MARTAASKIKALLGSRRFYLFILGFFVFESVWVALSAVYPQAFDENFHFGLIKVYSHYWLPFLAHQPAGANAFGAVARDPSYLYHYLMSFPYRLIAVFTHSQTAQVISLRLVNVGFFTAGLALFCRILRRIGLSGALTNTILLIFVLIPIIPQLAAQVTYDDLLFPLVAVACLLTFRVTDQLRQKQVKARDILILATVCLLASLVKDAFLPIFIGIVLYLAVIAWHSFRGQLKNFWSSFARSFSDLSRLAKVGLVVLMVISAGMFIQRDGLNIIQYHTVDPRCDAVLTTQQCRAYSVWQHDYNEHQNVVASPSLISSGPVAWVGEWLYWMWYRLFFAITGSYVNYPPLPLPAAGAVLIAIAGGVALVKGRRRLFHNNPYVAFLILISGLYILALMAEGYSTYQYTGILEFMNGRYLVPVLILLGALAAQAISLVLRKREGYKALAAVLAIALFIEGGGFLTFIARSDSSWDWPNSVVVEVNNAARHVTDHTVVNEGKTFSTHLWFFD